MQKRVRTKRLFLSIFEISLLVCMSFAIAFIMQESLVSSAEEIRYAIFKDGKIEGYNVGADKSLTGRDLVDSVKSNFLNEGEARKYLAEGGIAPKLSVASKPTDSRGFFSDLFGGDSAQGSAIVSKTGGSVIFKDGTGGLAGLNNVDLADGARIVDGGKGLGATIINRNGETIASLNPAEKAEFLKQMPAAGGEIVAPQKAEFLGTTLAEGGIAPLINGLMWAGVVAGATQLIGGLIGFSKENTNALTIAGVAGVMTWKGIQTLGPEGTNMMGNNFLVRNAGLIGIGVAVLVFVLLYKTTKERIVTFQCLPFEPPIGGERCEECNKDPFRPCSEYRCKSLGQACELAPVTDLTNPKCIWKSPKDVTSPTIAPWVDALSPKDLKYVTDTSIRPPALGVKIVRGNNGCLQAFTQLKFGVTTNEPAQCKIDYNHTAKFEDMQYYFGESNYYEYNHTQIMKLPSPATDTNLSGSPLIKNDGTFSLYVRCRDANGNENVDEYAVSFCVDKSPDTTPPIVEKASVNSGSPVRYAVDAFPIDIYVNEPADCKWSIQDKSYDDMENSMRCSSSKLGFNADYLYPCSANLTGIKDRATNTFFFRCRDQPDKADVDRNTMVQSYKLDLKGSQPLNIIKIEPNGTIRGSTSSINVDLIAETSNGAEEGKAICYFSNSQNLDSYIKMFSTNSYKHNQTLSLGGGTYTYYIRCVDAGGNTQTAQTTFNVQVDKSAPLVTRVYHDGDALKIVTDEDAECSYSLSDCNFNIDEGIKMLYNPPSYKWQSFAEWKPTSVYYIRCRDLYDNQAEPNKCSIIANAIQISKKE